jgi:hypothetical protein
VVLRTVVEADRRPGLPDSNRVTSVPATSPKVVCQNVFTRFNTSESKDLDNLYGLQYGLELVIPMLSRRLEAR